MGKFIKFIGYFGPSHLNSMNVGAYKTENGVTLRAEHIVNDEGFGEKEFKSYEDAETWFDELPGVNRISRLKNALEVLDGEKVAIPGSPQLATQVAHSLPHR